MTTLNNLYFSDIDVLDIKKTYHLERQTTFNSLPYGITLKIEQTDMAIKDSNAYACKLNSNEQRYNWTTIIKQTDLFRRLIEVYQTKNNPELFVLMNLCNYASTIREYDELFSKHERVSLTIEKELTQDENEYRKFKKYHDALNVNSGRNAPEYVIHTELKKLKHSEISFVYAEQYAISNSYLVKITYSVNLKSLIKALPEYRSYEDESKLGLRQTPNVVVVANISVKTYSGCTKLSNLSMGYFQIDYIQANIERYKFSDSIILKSANVILSGPHFSSIAEMLYEMTKIERDYAFFMEFLEHQDEAYKNYVAISDHLKKILAGKLTYYNSWYGISWELEESQKRPRPGFSESTEAERIKDFFDIMMCKEKCSEYEMRVLEKRSVFQDILENMKRVR